MLPWVRLTVAAARAALTRFLHSEDFTYASAIAYYSLVSLFPFLLFAVVILGRFTDSEAEREAATALVLQFLPDQVDLVARQLDSISEASVAFGIAGSVVVLWVSLGVFRVTSQAVNHAWGSKSGQGSSVIRSLRS